MCAYVTVKVISILSKVISTLAKLVTFYARHNIADWRDASYDCFRFMSLTSDTDLS
jgi:hypothetical protein